jgi:hypothetical protein
MTFNFKLVEAGAAWNFKGAAHSTADAYAGNGTDEVYVAGSGAAAGVNQGEVVVVGASTGSIDVGIDAGLDVSSETTAYAEALDTDCGCDYAYGYVETTSSASSTSSLSIDILG